MSINTELTLSKDDVSLRVLNNTHENSLTGLAAQRIIWEHAPEHFYESEIFKARWFDKALRQMEAEERICFVVFVDDKIVGSSSYYEIDLSNKKANIGYTWFHPSVWGTKINAITKLIMLEYAFETLNLHRVGFCVDSVNQRSCRALEKLGIKREGVLRNHFILPNKRIRHSIMFSVIGEEWKEVKNNLSKIIGQP